jgi:hypothetical protein
MEKNLSRYLFLLIPITLCLIAGICNGVMDTATFHFAQSRMVNWDPEYWNPTLSWCNKWAGCQPGYERFPMSSTLLVSLTDGWHLMKLLYSTLSLLGAMLILAFFVYDVEWDDKTEKEYMRYLGACFATALVLTKIAIGVGFHIAYEWWLPMHSSIHGI